MTFHLETNGMLMGWYFQWSNFLIWSGHVLLNQFLDIHYLILTNEVKWFVREIIRSVSFQRKWLLQCAGPKSNQRKWNAKAGNEDNEAKMFWKLAAGKWDGNRNDRLVTGRLSSSQICFVIAQIFCHQCTSIPLSTTSNWAEPHLFNLTWKWRVILSDHSTFKIKTGTVSFF